MNYIEAQNITVKTGPKRVLFEQLSLTVGPGSLVQVSGANGSGKTTLLRCLTGAFPVEIGEINYHIPTDEIFYLTQQISSQFHMPMTVGNVLDMFVPKTELAKIEHYGLLQENQLSLLWQKASGGEKMKTMLTAAFLSRPKLLLLDEPTNHLDNVTVELFANALSQFLSDYPESALVFISHDQLFTGKLNLKHKVTTVEVKAAQNG